MNEVMNQTPAEAALRQAREALAAANDTAARLPGSIASCKVQLAEALAATFAGRKPARSVAEICSEITAAELTGEVMPKVIRLLGVEEREINAKVQAVHTLETKRLELERYIDLRTEAIEMGTAGKVPTGGFLDKLAGAGRVAGFGEEVTRLLVCLKNLRNRQGYGDAAGKAAVLLIAPTGAHGDRPLMFLTDEQMAAAKSAGTI